MGGAAKTSGEVFICGKRVNFKNPSDAIRHRMCYITEDRQHTGLFMGHTIARNTIVANLVKNRKFIVDPKEDIKKGDEYIGRLRIKANDARVQVVNLSGGNQQKVVLAKWFNTEGDIFIFDEPTRGIDVGAKQEIYRLMTDLARNNKAILMVSSDMPEVVSMSDRIIVMKEGTVAGEIQRGDLSEENILQYSIGGSSI
jgi:ribose transport system ATP-binding protein